MAQRRVVESARKFDIPDEKLPPEIKFALDYFERLRAETLAKKDQRYRSKDVPWSELRPRRIRGLYDAYDLKVD